MSSVFDPIQPSQTAQLDATKATIVHNNITALQTLVSVVKSNWILVWENPDGLTPQQIFDSFGTNAVQLFVSGNAACIFVESQVPGSLDAKYLSAAQPYIINEDGTVKVGT